MPVDLQNRLFKYFTDTLHAIITQAKKSGRFDLGILGEYFLISIFENHRRFQIVHALHWLNVREIVKPLYSKCYIAVILKTYVFRCVNI